MIWQGISGVAPGCLPVRLDHVSCSKKNLVSHFNYSLGRWNIRTLFIRSFPSPLILWSHFFVLRVSEWCLCAALMFLKSSLVSLVWDPKRAILQASKKQASSVFSPAAHFLFWCFSLNHDQSTVTEICYWFSIMLVINTLSLLAKSSRGVTTVHEGTFVFYSSEFNFNLNFKCC